jgi:serine/threonine protein kinase
MPQEFQSDQQVGHGRYVLEKKLGRGGMGVVWLAKDQDQEQGEQVALKFMPPEIRSDPMALDDMRRETLKSRRLTHPNIARIHDFSNVEGEAPFISMEYMSGSNLSQLQVEQSGRVFGWNEVAPWVKQLCEALRYAHEENVVHRDLMPGNLMIDGKGRLKLCDFGLAASVADSLSRVSREMGSSGTPPYMSPQQLDGRQPTPADDVYGLGATIYELLTSKPPFYSGGIPHQIREIEARPIGERLSELGIENEVPAEVAALVMSCLSKNPLGRPKSAAAVGELAAGASFARMEAPCIICAVCLGEPLNIIAECLRMASFLIAGGHRS